jgi:short-subunit dehydrogenase
MRQQGAGSIVNVSSGIVFGALPGSGAYGASKAALAKFSAVARTELASVGIVVSTMYPFITATDFLKSLQTGHEMASRLEASHAPHPDKPERVAEAILDLIRTGAERADRVPEQFGGTLKD